MATNQSITCALNSPITRARSPHNGEADNTADSNIVLFTGAGNPVPILQNRKALTEKSRLDATLVACSAGPPNSLV